MRRMVLKSELRAKLETARIRERDARAKALSYPFWRHRARDDAYDEAETWAAKVQEYQSMLGDRRW